MSHPLTGFAFRHYKAFKDETRIELKPLTLVFGKNSSGKSALVRFPTMMLESISHESLGFRLRGEQFQYASLFYQLVHGNGPGFVMGRLEGTQLTASGRQVPWALEAELGPGRGTDMFAQTLMSWQLRLGRKRHTLNYKQESERPGIDLYEWTSGSRAKEIESCTFSGLMPNSVRLNKHIEEWETPRRSAHLGPIRPTVMTSWECSEYHPEWKAESWPHWLLRSQQGNGELLRRVNRWLEESLGWQLRLEEQAGSAAVPQRFSVVLKRREERTWQNLSQLGTGMNQVLPVLVQAEAVALGELHVSLAVCEEPESHLHPAAHAALADLYLKTAQLREPHPNVIPRPAMLVETHSEVLLLRIRRRVAEGLDPSQIALYFMDDQNGYTTAHRLKLDSDGWVEDWPTGIFEEDSAERRAIGRALRKEQHA